MLGQFGGPKRVGALVVLALLLLGAWTLGGWFVLFTLGCDEESADGRKGLPPDAVSSAWMNAELRKAREQSKRENELMRASIQTQAEKDLESRLSKVKEEFQMKLQEAREEAAKAARMEQSKQNEQELNKKKFNLRASIGFSGGQSTSEDSDLDFGEENPVEVVDVLRGTNNRDSRSNSRGNALPIISRPFGMSHWAVANHFSNRPWFFNSITSSFSGIRCTHQPSPWIGDYGYFDISPFFDGKGSSKYNMDNAVFKPYFLQISLPNLCNTKDQCVRIEMTGTEHGALFVFHMPAGQHQMGISFAGMEDLSITPERSSSGIFISGFSRKTTVFQAPSTMKHFTYMEAWRSDGGPLQKDGANKVTFNGLLDKPVIVTLRVGNSFISSDQAKLNMDREVPKEKTFQEVVDEGRNTWNSLLGRVTITADTPKELEELQVTLHSCLYRGLLFPRQLGEVNAEGHLVHWSPYDDKGGIYDGPLSTDSGFWDAYRTVYPMLHLIFPDLVQGILEGWVNAIREDPNKMLTQWASPGRVGSMEGSMGEVTMAEAIVNGALTPESAADALRYLKKSTMNKIAGNGRAHLHLYMKHGYVPAGPKRDGVVSLSLNYYLADFCSSLAIDYMGDSHFASQLRERSLKWTNLFDKEKLFFRPKGEDGRFSPGFNEYMWMGPYTEGGPWQYRFYVPHDPKGLRDVYESAHPSNSGPHSRMCMLLREMMIHPATVANRQKIHEETEMQQQSFGQYAHNNQPVHHVLYMFAHAGCPLDGQRWIHHTLRTQYGEFGFAGDEDNGEMSSWFVLSSLGLYALVPGSGNYQIGAPPLYRSITIKRKGRGGTLKITREMDLTAPDSHFKPATRAVWNGRNLDLSSDAAAIPYQELLNGGVLTFFDK